MVLSPFRTIVEPSGRYTAVSAVVVKFTPLRVRVFVSGSHVLSSVPVFAALSRFSAAVGSVEKSAFSVAGSAASATVGSMPTTITRASSMLHSLVNFVFAFISIPPCFFPAFCRVK